MRYYLDINKKLKWLYEQVKCLNQKFAQNFDQNNLILNFSVTYDSQVANDLINKINAL